MLVADLLTTVVAGAAIGDVFARSKRARQADPAYVAPWGWAWRAATAAARRVGQELRRWAARLRALVRRRRTVDAGASLSAEGSSLTAGGATLTPTVEERFAALERRVTEVEARLREEVLAGDRATLVEAVGPSSWECVIVAFAVAFAVLAARLQWID